LRFFQHFDTLIVSACIGVLQGLIQALVGAYWQYYEKTHTEDFPLQQLEQAANPQEKLVPKMGAEPAIDGPLS
jgi:hypothetical protein